MRFRLPALLLAIPVLLATVATTAAARPSVSWTSCAEGRAQCATVPVPIGHGGVGYLLKHRVGALDDFLDALVRVAAGGSAMDPEVVAQLLSRSRDDRLGTLSGREREVLGLMAEGLSNSAIAERLVLALPSVEKHIGNILTKLDLPPSQDVHRRVLAVLAHLGGR